MKTCPKCGRQYADTNTLCPTDGTVLKKSAKDDALLGQVLAGKYRIEEKIDEGGMGCVYRATHVLMEKTVAIKVLHPALAADDKIVARFTREAKAASRISHPHAIVVTDFGEAENGVVYMVMEYLRGSTLKDVIRAEGPLPLARTAEIVRQVAGALEAAHAEGVIHRDLKSDNIMLEETSTGGDWAKVLDFGIAKIQQDVDVTDPGLTAPNIIIGTPQYMSPEQCSQAARIDARSDVYSFGVILFEMLAGHVPFAGDSPTATMMKHLQEPPPPILEERKDLPASVAKVVERALAKNPEERFQSAEEMADALTVAAKDATAPEVGAADTGRIIIPTGPNDPARTTLEEDDEATVVSARHRRLPVEEVPPPPAEEVVPSFVAAPPPASGFSPWRVAIPAVAALAIIFAVVFAFQRRGSTSANEPQTQPSLISDPNGKPVQSIAPPTGQAERNIAPVAATPTPAAAAAENVPVAGAVNAVASPTPGRGRRGANENQNQQTDEENAGENTNEGQNDNEQKKPTPTPTPRARRVDTLNSNQDDTPPPPVPTKKQKQKQPETPPDNPPKLDDNNPPKLEDSSAPPGANSSGPDVKL
ncbi:MAG TPA: serine/threonine-protein kinase [Pyrinomonadaceae bacterium]|nr:serine/threonine-protein kinase [Pyrinomonadaceae bacterium]